MPVLPKMSMAADAGRGICFAGLAVVKMSFIKFGFGRNCETGKKENLGNSVWPAKVKE
jgi:hypothetical protein